LYVKAISITMLTYCDIAKVIYTTKIMVNGKSSRWM